MSGIPRGLSPTYPADPDPGFSHNLRLPPARLPPPLVSSSEGSTDSPETVTIPSEQRYSYSAAHAQPASRRQSRQPGPALPPAPHPISAQRAREGRGYELLVDNPLVGGAMSTQRPSLYGASH
ncbi:Hypothetical predicted protein [Pelobates cultripes]|uniref:Uncharacterized protein n=1 Tax=Pelobates cultripes TaxID=61616 RepID=A0AAD1SE23_PELCU|nr:Hypothetical predicted protein [Pelobates cultripes]